MKLEFIAKIISRIFDVPVTLGIAIIVFFYMAEDFQDIPNYYLLIGILYLLILPAIFIFLLIKLNILDKWDLSRKSLRKYAYIVEIIFILFILLLSKLISLHPIYIKTIVFALITTVLYMLITELTPYKISMHISAATICLYMLAYVYSLRFLILFPLIILIGWSRLKLKNHSLSELLLGFFLTSIIMAIFLYMI